MQEFYTLVTNIGKQKIAKAMVTGIPVEIVDFAIGDGGGIPVKPSESMKGLVNEVWRSNATEYLVEDGSNIISISAVVPADVGGWTGREMAVLDIDGDMIAIANMPEARKTIPSSGAGTELVFAMKIAVESTDAITVVIDSSLQFVTQEEFNGHIKNKNNPHTVTREQIKAASEKEFKEHINNKKNPHNVTAKQIGAAEKAHTHDAKDITSGILTVSRGGTGAEAFTTDFPLFGDGEDALKALKPQLAMAKLGYAYGVCNTEADITEKTVDIEGYVLFTGSHAYVKFTYDVPAGATLNINGTGDISILRWNSTLLAENIMAGDIAEFVFDGSNWNLVSVSASLKSAAGIYTGSGGQNDSITLTVNFIPVFVYIRYKNIYKELHVNSNTYQTYFSEITVFSSNKTVYAMGVFSNHSISVKSGSVTVSDNKMTIKIPYINYKDFTYYYTILGY